MSGSFTEQEVVTALTEQEVVLVDHTPDDRTASCSESV